METDYPGGDSSYYLPTEPKEQEIERKKERAKTLQDEKVLKKLVKLFEERIEFYSRIDSIDVDINTDTQKFFIAFQVAAATRQNLIVELERIKSLLDSAGVKDV